MGGPFIDREGRIIRGPLVAVHGELVDETAGRLLSDTGPFSLGLQAHAVTGMGPDCLLVRREALLDLVASRPARSDSRCLRDVARLPRPRPQGDDRL